MAGSSSTSDSTVVTKVWTFIIRGGEPFDLSAKAKGPGLQHDGLMTIWKMVGTKAEADSVQALITGPFVGARVERHTESQSPEMQVIRDERLGIKDADL